MNPSILDTSTWPPPLSSMAVQWHAVTASSTRGSVQLQIAIFRQRSQHGRLSHGGLTEGQLLEGKSTGNSTGNPPGNGETSWNNWENLGKNHGIWGLQYLQSSSLRSLKQLSGTRPERFQGLRHVHWQPLVHYQLAEEPAGNCLGKGSILRPES